MKVFKYILYLFPLIISAGCTSSSIVTKLNIDNNSYDMFGRVPSRNFYIAETVSDSIKKLWESEVNGGFTNSSVSVLGDYVFVNDLSGRVFCFNIKSGKEIGELKYKGAVYTTPVINKIYIIYVVNPEDQNISFLYYYGYTEGTVIKKDTIRGKVLTQLIKSKDGIILNSDEGYVYKFGLYGKKIWETQTKKAIHSSPALSNGKIVFGNDNGEIICINEKNGKIEYRKKIGRSFYGGAAISHGIVYIGNDNGYIYALNLNNGKVLWKYDTGTRIIMTPCFNEKNVFVGNLNGDLFSFDKINGRMNWEKNIAGLLNATPLITKNLIIAPDYADKLYFVNINTGNVVNSIHLPGHAKLSPVFWKNKLFIGYDNYNLRAYEFVK